MNAEPDSGYSRLEDQIDWYSKRSAKNQDWYKRLKFIEIGCAALVPLTVSYFPLVAGLLGVAVIVLEGLQHLNQFHRNWATYRSTCEALKHEKYLYLGKSGPYDLIDDQALKVLIERVEALISTEHSKWVFGREQAKKEFETRGQ